MRLLVPPFICLALSACPDRAPTPAPRLDLSQQATAPAPRATLGPVALATQADFDRLEDTLLDRRSPQGLVSALSLLAEGPLAAPAGTPLAESDALLLQRLAILHISLAGAMSAGNQAATPHMDRAQALIGALIERAPSSPHTLFLEGYISFTSLGGTDRRDAYVDASAGTRAMAAASVVARWRLLLAQTPDYQGPRGYTAERIAAAANQIEAALATEVPAAHAAAPSRRATPAEVSAFAELARLERSPDGVRTTSCRDWLRARAEDEPVALARLSLFCATHQGDVELALKLVERLDREDVGAFDACLALARLQDRVPAERLSALSGHPLTARCAR